MRFKMDFQNKIRSKKGDGMSINIVVVAVLALVVLVILLAIFSNKMRVGSKGQDDAQKNLQSNICSDTVEGRSYYCSPVSCTSGPGKRLQDNYIDCPKESGFCCVKTP